MKREQIHYGFTLAELLLVVALIAILAVSVLLSFQHQTARGYDAKRKTDLTKLRTVFEDYYNDNNCYPPKDKWDLYDCATGANGDFLVPTYVSSIPCDPRTNTPYLYITMPEGVANGCSGYKLFAALEQTSDPDIISSGCSPDPRQGCGYDPTTYNYGIAVGTAIANPLFDFTAPIVTPSPTPGGSFGIWICPVKALNEEVFPNCQGYTEICRDKMISEGCLTYADEDTDECDTLCHQPNQPNACEELTEFSECTGL